MYTASDLRKGLKVQIDGDPFIIIDFEFSKPGKGQALYRTKMRSMISGNQFTQTYRSNDKFEKPDLEERTMQYLYSQNDEFHFIMQIIGKFWNEHEESCDSVRPADGLGTNRFYC